MIRRIEPGWVQVNDALSKKYGQARRRPRRPKGEKSERDAGLPSRRDEALLDLVA